MTVLFLLSALRALILSFFVQLHTALHSYGVKFGSNFCFCFKIFVVWLRIYFIVQSGIFNIQFISHSKFVMTAATNDIPKFGMWLVVTAKFKPCDKTLFSS